MENSCFTLYTYDQCVECLRVLYTHTAKFSALSDLSDEMPTFWLILQGMNSM